MRANLEKLGKLGVLIIVQTLLIFNLTAQSGKEMLLDDDPVLRAQDLDEQLYGVWLLDSVEISLGGMAKKYVVDALLTDKNILPVNMFTIISFFEDQLKDEKGQVEVDIRYAELEFTAEKEKSLKGVFVTHNGQLTMTLAGKPPRVFAYAVENERLKMKFSYANISFTLLYKLIFKIQETP